MSKHKDGKSNDSGRNRDDDSKKISPKVVITFIVAFIVIAVIMAFNRNLFDWYNPLFGG